MKASPSSGWACSPVRPPAAVKPDRRGSAGIVAKHAAGRRYEIVRSVCRGTPLASVAFAEDVARRCGRRGDAVLRHSRRRRQLLHYPAPRSRSTSSGTSHCDDLEDGGTEAVHDWGGDCRASDQEPGGKPRPSASSRVRLTGLLAQPHGPDRHCSLLGYPIPGRTSYPGPRAAPHSRCDRGSGDREAPVEASGPSSHRAASANRAGAGGDREICQSRRCR